MRLDEPEKRVEELFTKLHESTEFTFESAYEAFVLDRTIAWYDPAVGGFYISERTIPENIKKTGRLIELIRKPK